MSDVLDLEPFRHRAEGQQEWLTKNHPECQVEQKHLEDGSVERAYWHYGYMVALRDMLRYLTKSAEKPEGPK